MHHILHGFRSEANDLALNIADTVTGHTEHISVDG